MYKVFLSFPDALRPAFPRLKEKLEDPDPGSVSESLNTNSSGYRLFSRRSTVGRCERHLRVGQEKSQELSQPCPYFLQTYDVFY